jgi:hypothetical protein
MDDPRFGEPVDPRISFFQDASIGPDLPAWVWRRTSSSIVTQLTKAAGLGRFLRPSGLQVYGSWQFWVLAFGLAPFVLASIAGLAGSSPQIDNEFASTAWLVEATVLGLVVAIAVFGLQIILDSSLRVITSIAGARFLASLKSGVVLVTVTGISVFEGSHGPFFGWLRAFTVWLGLVWAAVVAIGLSDAVGAASPKTLAKMIGDALSQLSPCDRGGAVSQRLNCSLPELRGVTRRG